MDTKTAVLKLKKLPFFKSWQNSFVSKSKNIVNFETGKLEPKELEVFLYIPALSILQIFSNDREFLNFRMENKFSDEFNYNLLSDKTDNNNRRLAVMYVATFLKAIGVEFLLDDVFTIYILNDELQKLNSSEDTALKEFYNSLYIPKHYVRKGIEETFY